MQLHTQATDVLKQHAGMCFVVFGQQAHHPVLLMPLLLPLVLLLQLLQRHVGTVGPSIRRKRRRPEVLQMLPEVVLRLRRR